MKPTWIVFFMMLFCLTFGTEWKTTANASTIVQMEYPTSITPLPLVQDMINQVSQERILQDLRRFTGVEPLCTSNGCRTLSGRFTESDDLQWTKDYVYETLVGLHYSVEVLDWSDSGLSGQNILAHKWGSLYPDEEIYFIAHLDGYPENGPAANDDGSGAVALLELARILSNQHFRHSVTLFFSTGEEQGSVGSHRFVAEYPERLGSIKYVVSVEMLAYDHDADGLMELWSGDQPTAFVEMLSDIINAYPIALTPDIVTGCT